MGLLITLARQIPEGATAARQGQFPRLSGVSLEGKTVGIVGSEPSASNWHGAWPVSTAACSRTIRIPTVRGPRRFGGAGWDG